MTNFIDDVHERFLKIEDEILSKVAEQCLGRPFEAEDAERFVFVFKEGEFSRYDISFDGSHIGKVVKEYYNPDGKMTVSFIPKENPLHVETQGGTNQT